MFDRTRSAGDARRAALEKFLPWAMQWPVVDRVLSSELVSYAALGAIGVAVDVMSFAALHRAGLHILQANVLSVALGIMTSFLLNSKFTFDRRDRRLRRLTKFLIVGLIGLGLSSASLSLLVHSAGFAAVLAKAMTIPPVAAFQYMANRTWTFREYARLQ